MVDLSPKASAVVEAARRGLRPTDADRDRIEAALRARLGPSALPPEPLASNAGWGWSFVVPGAAIGACLIALGLFLASGSRPSGSQEPRVVEAPPSAVASSEPSAATHSAPELPLAELASETAAVVAARPAAPERRDQLAAEVALLSRATSALGAGRASEALKVLNQHQREFPSGILSEERRAAKAQALCSLGATIAVGRPRQTSLRRRNAPRVTR